MTTRKTLLKELGLLLLSLILFLGMPAIARSQQVEPVDEIIAVVNDDIIVRSELDNEIMKIVAQLRQQGQRLPPQAIIEKQVLDRLILKKLQLEAAARAGINVSEDVVAQAINNIAQNNNLNLSEFRRALEDEGISFGGFRRNIQEEITLKQLLDQEVRRRIRVTDQEVETISHVRPATWGNAPLIICSTS